MTIWRLHIHKVVLRLPDSWSNWSLEMLVFEKRGKPEYRRKTSRSKGKNQQHLNPQIASTPGNEPGPHWWEESALTTSTALSLASHHLQYSVLI